MQRKVIAPAAQERFAQLRRSLKGRKLATVCEEAKCPNIGECWGGGVDGSGPATATIMLMGDTCTRACRFCSVKTASGPLPPPSEAEAAETAAQVAAMGVEFVVITMVDRDDLPDGGAAHVANVMAACKAAAPSVLLEALVGDFSGRLPLVEAVASSPLDVFAHNVETVERLTPSVRDRRAGWAQSLRVLEAARRAGDERERRGGATLLTKSSIMLGLGETEAEVEAALRSLRSAGVSAVTLGQYLQPNKMRMRVTRYLAPAEFEEWGRRCDAMGFDYAASGPLVRSSYRAGEFYLQAALKRRAAKAAAAAAEVTRG